MTSPQAPAAMTDAVTAAYLRAAEAVITRSGYAALTVGGLAAAVGRTRPTLYRRWPSSAHLALDVVVARYSSRPAVDTGSLRDDLLALQRQDLAMFTDPLVVNSLPGLLAAAERDQPLAQRIAVELIGPHRRAIAAAVERAVARAEIDVDIAAWEENVDFICELLTGPLLARVVTPGAPALDENLVHRTVEAAMRALTARSPRGMTVQAAAAGVVAS